AILGHAGTPFTVIHLVFDHAEALSTQQRRQEAVHAVEHRHLPQRGTTHHAHAAAAVGHVVAGDPVAEAVGHARRDPAHDIVLTASPHAGDAIGALGEGAFKHAGQIGRIILA